MDIKMGVNQVVISSDRYHEQRPAIIDFLKDCGIGTSRFGGRTGEVKHWLGTDDWCYYDQWETQADPDLNHVINTVFIFRSERAAVEFALRFA